MRKKILELLKERGITKTQMAREVDITPQYLNMIIKGTAVGSDKVWRGFMRAYDITLNEIESYKKKG